MRVLITNRALDARAGTELFVRDLALALQSMGHEPVCFAPVLGEAAQEIRAAGVAVHDRLEGLDPPDIIHAHHHPAAMAALSTFPDAPAIFVCHGVKPWQEAPLARLPNIRAYVAVDEACRDYLVEDHGVDPAAIRLIPNGVDLDRFAPGEAEPTRLGKALLLSNIAKPDSLPPFRQACGRAGLSFDAAGAGLGRPLERPETAFPQYGLVFAKARAAMEAMACGCTVMLADYGRVGPVVTPENFDRLKALNFGFKVIEDVPEADLIASRLAAIDRTASAEVTARIRAEAGFDRAAQAFADLYAEALGAPSLHPGGRADALQAYLLAILPRLEERDELAGRLYRTVSDGLARDRALSRLILAAAEGKADRLDLAREAVRRDPENAEARALLDALRKPGG